MPLYIVALGGWLKVFGFGLLTSRLFTVFCGAVVLILWYYVVRRLTIDSTVALVTFALLAGDYGFVLRASEVRMDMLSAAFGFGGLAVYLYLRTRSFSWAVFLSHLCVSASAFTHPNGGMVAFAGLIFLTFYYDRRSIRFSHAIIALFPYIVGAAGWGLYIAQDVESFKAQFLLNLTHGGRTDTFGSPLTTLKREIAIRYLGSLGGLAGTSALSKLKVFIVIAYFCGAAGVLATRSLRQQKGYRALLILTGIYFIVLAFTDGRKSQCYVVHVIPLYAALLASVIVSLWRTRNPVTRGLIVAAVIALSIIHAGGIAYHVRKDSYHKDYLPVISFIKTNASSDQLIMGPGVLGFGLAYAPNLMDDFRLGKVNGMIPEWIVVNEWYESWFEGLKASEPDTYRFVQNRLQNEFRPVYKQSDYTVYRRNGTALGEVAHTKTQPGL